MDDRNSIFGKDRYSLFPRTRAGYEAHTDTSPVGVTISVAIPILSLRKKT
jgi:hypothetical protein